MPAFHSHSGGEIHVPAERDAASSPHLGDTKRGAGRGLVQPRMTKQGAQRRQADWFPPYRPGEDEGSIGVPAAAEHIQADLSGPAPRNHRQRGQADGREAVGAMLGGGLRLWVGGIGGTMGVAHVLVRIPAERGRGIRPRPG